MVTINWIWTHEGLESLIKSLTHWRVVEWQLWGRVLAANTAYRCLGLKQKLINSLEMGFLPPQEGHPHRGPCTHSEEQKCNVDCATLKGKWLFTQDCLQDINFEHINFCNCKSALSPPSTHHTHTHTSPHPRDLLWRTYAQQHNIIFYVRTKTKY